MVTLDAERHTCRIDQSFVHLTKLEFDLLAALMAAEGRVLTKAWLLDHVWQYEHDLETNAVATHVCNIRRKLKREGWRILTVRGVGWRFLERKEV